MASEQPPSLAVSDVSHALSPSSTHPNASSSTGPTPPQRSHTPEPVLDAEKVNILHRLAELGLSGIGEATSSSNGKEFSDMIVRLASDVPLDISQLDTQAATISNLIAHRDFLVQRADEDRQRWESDKEGWERMAEALITQHRRIGSPAVSADDLERQCAIFESDNKSLREQLVQTQSRLASLELELAKLRPVLLMQPLSIPSSNSHHLSADSHAKHISTHARKKKGKEKEKEKELPSLKLSRVLHILEHDIEDEIANDPNATPTKMSALQYHRRITRKLTARTPKTSTKKPQALLADARSEHLLLAARKIGRQRTGIVAGLATDTKEAERERRDDANVVTNVDSSSPKTPRHGPVPIPVPVAVSVPMPVNTNAAGPSPAFAHPASNPAFLFPLTFTGSPVRPQYILPYAPVQTRTPTRNKGSTSVGANPPTPLDSLLDAARLMDNRGDLTPLARDEQGRARAADSASDTADWTDVGELGRTSGPSSPKRRKIARGDSGMKKHGALRVNEDATKGRGTSLGRAKSALDVLADQAAVFGSKEKRDAEDPSDEGRRRTGVFGKLQQASTKVDRVRKVNAGASEKEKGGERGGRARVRNAKASQTTSLPHEWSATHADTTFRAMYQSTEEWGTGSLRPVTRWGSEGPPSSTVTPMAANKQQGSDGSIGSGSGGRESSHTRPSSPDSPSPASRSIINISGQASKPSTAEMNPREHARGDGRRQSFSRNSRTTPPLTTLPRSRSEDGERSQPLLTPRRASSIPPSSSLSPPLQPRQQARSARVARNGEVAEDGLAMEREDRDEHGSSDIVGGTATSIVNSQEVQVITPEKRHRGPYVKWSKDEDDLLTQAVAKYGQKWDLVQKALPSRGYHQVRQRWLRKMGVFDSKLDLSSYQMGASGIMDTVQPRMGMGGEEGAPVDPPPTPKLGLAPLSSERVLSGFRRSSTSGHE